MGNKFSSGERRLISQGGTIEWNGEGRPVTVRISSPEISDDLGTEFVRARATDTGPGFWEGRDVRIYPGTIREAS